MNVKKLLMAIALTLAATTAFAATAWTPLISQATHNNYVDMQTNPKNYHMLWDRKFPLALTHDLISRGPVIADKTVVYVQNAFEKIGHEHSASIIALDLATGAVMWEQKQPELSMDDYPTYDGKHLLVSARSIDRYNLYAYNVKTGEDYTVASVPYQDHLLIYQGKSYFYNNGKISMFNSENGEVTDTGIHANGNYALTMDAKYLVAEYVGSSMAIVNRNKKAVEYYIDSPVFSELRVLSVLDEKTQTLFKSYDPSNNGSMAMMFAYDLHDGKEKWHLMQGGFNVPIVIGDEVLSQDAAYWEDAKLNALNVQTGEVKWTWQPPAGDRFLTGVTGPYMLATKDVVFVPCEKHTFAVSLKTHKTVWQTDKVGYLAIADDTLIISNGGDGATAFALK